MRAWLGWMQNFAALRTKNEFFFLSLLCSIKLGKFFFCPVRENIEFSQNMIIVLKSFDANIVESKLAR